MTQRTSIIITVLRELINTPQGYLTPAMTIATSVNLAIRPSPTASSLADILSELEDKRLIIATRNDLTQALSYRITDAGRSAYSELVN